MMVGVVLAAGASRRMGRPKPLVRSSGKSFAAHGIRHLWSGCNEVVVVLGSNAAMVRTEVEAEFQRMVGTGELGRDLRIARRHGAAELEVHFASNPKWKSGMYGSVRFGLKRALELDPEGVLVLPVDHPAVRPETVIGLAELLRASLGACRSARERHRFRYALVPRYRRRRGHPVALSAALARDIAGDSGAENLSDAIRRNARLLGFLDVEDPGVVKNVNSKAD